MELFKPRKIMFKAWNKETKLLMRLNSIECKRGELIKKDHIILQFTGLYDKQEEEVYEMDILLIVGEKFIVRWDESRNGWCLAKLANPASSQPLSSEQTTKGSRLWSYFEADNKV